MKYNRFGLIAAVLAVVVMSMVPPAAAKEGFTLPAIHQDIQSRYTAVRHISGAQLQKIQATKTPLLLLDVREIAEYQVSHIKGAEHVAPNIWHSPFLRRFSNAAKGKTVVLYCSVGVRSSKLARYVQDALRKAGATQVYNLEGGIFAWHNDDQTLISADGPSEFVHPYDRHWGQLLKRTNLIRYSPKK